MFDCGFGCAVWFDKDGDDFYNLEYIAIFLIHNHYINVDI